MNETLMFLIVVGVAIMGIGYYIREKNEALKRKISSEWGKFPRRLGQVDPEDSIRVYWDEKQKYFPSEFVVDDITWRDLNMLDLFYQMNSTKSSVGAEFLYMKLRTLEQDIEHLQAFEETIAYFQEQASVRKEVQYYLSKLGKVNHNRLSSYAFKPDLLILEHSQQYLFLAVLPFVAILLTILVPQIGVILLVVSLLTNATIFMKRKKLIDSELRGIGYLVNLIHFGSKISRFNVPQQKDIKNATARLMPVKKAGNTLAYRDDSEMGMFLQIFYMFFLIPFIKYNKVVKMLGKYQEELKQLWEKVGEIDAAIAVANYRQALPYYSLPIFHESATYQAQDLYHPLLSHPVPNAVDWKKNTIVTGSNASGKSTYIKSVAINAIAAQTIHMCFTSETTLQPAIVMSSMALEDNIFEGESYFVTEIKSLRRMIRAAEKGLPCYFFIDEILRGTNTIERISASSTIVNWLSRRNTLAFIASHDIELTEILKAHCDNIHFRETVNAKGISFDYLLHQGPSTTRNAIRLLASLDYPAEIIKEADEAANDFVENRSWQTK